MDQPTKTESPATGRIPIGLYIFVCIAGIGVGAFFGSFEYPFGTALGGAGGLVAGLLWTRTMADKVRQGCSGKQIIVAGTGWGIVVGLLATAILWGGVGIRELTLARNPGGSDLPGLIVLILLVAAGCGVVAGAFTGGFCGAICQWLWLPHNPPAAQDTSCESVENKP